MASHQILRQVIELQRGPADGPAQRQLQARVQRLWREHLLPAITRACDQAAPAGRRLRVERLVLDLGAQPWLAAAPDDGEPDPSWPEALARQTEGLLLRRLGELAQAAAPVAVADEGPSAALELLDQFVYSGCLPWWADLQAAAPLARACLDLAQALRQPGAGPAWRSRLRPWPDSAWQRLAAAVDDATLAALLASLAGPSPGGQDSDGRAAAAWRPWVQAHLQAAMQVQAAARPPAALLRRRLWQQLLVDALAGAGPSAAPAAMARASLARVARALGLPLQAWRAAAVRLDAGAVAGLAGVPAESDSLADQPSSQGGMQAWRGWLERLGLLRDPASADAAQALLQHLQAALPAGLPAPPEPGAGLAQALELAGQRLAPALAGHAGLAQAWAGLRRSVEPRPAAARPAAGDALNVAVGDEDLQRLPVANAGLVWLWPFLTMAFDRLGWLAPAAAGVPRGFAQDGLADRAALWLHALARGPESPGEGGEAGEAGLLPEHRLPLCKLLCGLPPQHGLDVDEALTGAELDEAEAVLAAMLLRAPILRGLSVAGLRGSFLLRPGLLSVRDGHWLLRAERASWDLVLDRVPWSVGLLRLPWMAQPLQVEW